MTSQMPLIDIISIGPSSRSLASVQMGLHFQGSTPLSTTSHFGAPNGLCSSITESKHIKAVKQPWRRSSHYEALGQMLLTNQHLDKLAAAHVNFTHCGMLDGTILSATLKMIGEPYTQPILISNNTNTNARGLAQSGLP